VKGFVEDLPRLQYEWGRALAETSNLGMVSIASILLVYPNLLRGFMHQRAERKKFVDVFARDFVWTEP